MLVGMSAERQDLYGAAAARTIAWLVAQQHADGSLGPDRRDLAYYHKAPLLLLLGGRAHAAHRMLDHVRSFQQRDGGFASTSELETIDPVLAQYPGYIDGWLAMAAHRAGRFELARPAWAYLRRFAHPGVGGFCLAGAYRGEGNDDVIDLLTTAHLGTTALYLGELPLALAAGHCMRRFWEAQPDPARLLLRMDDSGDFVREWPSEAADLHVVERGAARHTGFVLGHAIAFLVLLARATGNSLNLARAHLAVAKAFAHFAEDCGEALIGSPFAHEVAWGLGLLDRTSRDPRYGELAHAIAAGMLARQTDQGTWLDDAADLTRVDQSCETALWLHELATM